MDPQSVFCPNPDCPARGRSQDGDIGIHSQKERRYICRICGKTFAESKGTAFYRLRTATDIVFKVVTLLAYGCPVQAIVAAFSLDERTVVAWQERAGRHCEQVHEHLVQQPRDLGQVQADERDDGRVIGHVNADEIEAGAAEGRTPSPTDRERKS